MEEIKAAAPAATTPSLTATPMPASSHDQHASDWAVLSRVVQRHRRGLLVGVAALVLVAAIPLATWRWWPGRVALGAPIDSVAVLPFVNASGSPDADYLADGLAETLTNSLAQIRTLRVVPRTLAAHYRGQTVDPREAGRSLNVRAIVTGRVVQRGDQLTVQVQLIDTASVAQLWGDQQFNRPLSGALALQGEISKAVADNLRLRLTNEDEKHLDAGTSDPAAYQLYLNGRYEWNKRNKDSLARAAESLRGGDQARFVVRARPRGAGRRVHRARVLRLSAAD